MSVTEIQFGPVNGEMLTLARPDGSPLEGYFGASVGDWGISASNGALYFDTSGATVGEQAVIGIDPTGVAFLEPAVSVDAEPLYSSVELLSVMRESRESVEPVFNDALIEQQRAREIREDHAEAPDSSVPARSSDGRGERQSLGAVPDSSDLRAQAAAARDARQRPVASVRKVVDGVARGLRQGPVKASTIRLVRGDDDGRENRETTVAASNVVEVEQRARAAREARQKAVVLEDSAALEAVRRAMRDRRQDANKESER